jgi:parallel beta-helix repeat protein
MPSLSAYFPTSTPDNPITLDSDIVYSPASRVVAPVDSDIKADYYTDGISDNEQIQAALTLVGNLGGGRVRIKEGSYNIRAVVTIPSNVILEGEGAATILTLVNNVNMFTNADTTGGNSNIVIRRLKLVGDSATNTSGNSGIWLTKCTDSAITDCIVSDFKGNGIWLTNCANTTVARNKILIAGSSGHGFKTSGTTAGYNIYLKVHDNYISGCINNGAEVSDTTHSTFNRNKFLSSGKNGVSGYRNYFCIFDGNHANDNTWSGIDLEGARNCTFTNGVYNNNTLNGLGVERNYSDDIKSQFCVFAGNVASNNGRSGYFCQNADYVTVVANSGENNSRTTSNLGALFHAYFESGTPSTTYCSYLNIANNTYADTRGTSLSTYGITESGTAGVNFSMANSSVMGNVVNGALTSSVRVLGTTSLARNNKGYTTEASGTASVANGATAGTVTHGLSATPTVKDISLTPINNMGSASKLWVASAGATTFVVNVNTDPGATTTQYAWKAEIL